MDKNKVMMIVIIALLVILLGSIGGVSWYAMKIMKVSSQGGSTDASQAVATEAPQLSQSEIEIVKLSNAINTNLLESSDGEEHVVRIDLGIGVDNTDKKNSATFVTLISSKEMVVRDIVIGILRNKTYDELKRPDGQDILRSEILTKLQNQFDTNLIVDTYISDFYLQ